MISLFIFLNSKFQVDSSYLDTDFELVTHWVWVCPYLRFEFSYPFSYARWSCKQVRILSILDWKKLSDAS